ncbi:MAG: zeta toxin family protein [Chitinophagales bacterium]
MPELYIIAGCNGAGKTTVAFTMLPEFLHCREFVNADEIAKGISPFEADKISFLSGRLMLARITELISQEEDFAFETSLSNLAYGSLIKKARDRGYHVTLIFLYLKSELIAFRRIINGVKDGNHFMPDDVVARRYKRGIKNLFNLYLPLADHWMVIDNSDVNPEMIASGGRDMDMDVMDEKIWEEIKHKARDF